MKCLTPEIRCGTNRDRFFSQLDYFFLTVKFYHALVATIGHRNDRITETNKKWTKSGRSANQSFPRVFFNRSAFHSFLGLHMRKWIFYCQPGHTYSRQPFCLSLQSRGAFRACLNFLWKRKRFSRWCPDISIQIALVNFTVRAQRECACAAISRTCFEILPFCGH